MNNDILKYRKLAFEIKRDYPLMNVSFDEKDDFLGKFINPTKLFITKSKYGLSSIFTYRRYENLERFGKGWAFNIDEHDLILSSNIFHDRSEIIKVLMPYFNEFGFARRIFNKVNTFRYKLNEISDANEDPDVDNFGCDLVETVNKYLFQIHSYNILRRKFQLINLADIEAFGEDFFEVTKKIAMHDGFIEDFRVFDDKKFDLDVEMFGEDLIEIIKSRSHLFDYYIRDHFNENIGHQYIIGNDSILSIIQ